MAELLTLRLSELRLPDEPEAWKRLGFVVSGDTFDAGGLVVRLDPTDDTPAWTFTRVDDESGSAGTVELDVDGIPTLIESRAAPNRAGESTDPHPNGIVGVDHVVLTTPDGARTAAALAALGLELRRRRPTTMGGIEMEQWFYRPGTIVEVASPAAPHGDGPARIWGVTLVASDLPATVRHLGPLLSTPRAAVQQGRQIASVRREAGLRTRVAVMDAHRPRSSHVP